MKPDLLLLRSTMPRYDVIMLHPALTARLELQPHSIMDESLCAVVRGTIDSTHSMFHDLGHDHAGLQYLERHSSGLDAHNVTSFDMALPCDGAMQYLAERAEAA